MFMAYRFMHICISDFDCGLPGCRGIWPTHLGRPMLSDLIYMKRISYRGSFGNGARWIRGMQTLSAFLVLCKGNSPFTGISDYIDLDKWNIFTCPCLVWDKLSQGNMHLINYDVKHQTRIIVSDVEWKQVELKLKTQTGVCHICWLLCSLQEVYLPYVSISKKDLYSYLADIFCPCIQLVVIVLIV